MRAGFLLAAMLAAPFAVAQYTAPYVGLTGKIASANGMPAANYALTFTPTQVMYVDGTSMVVSPADCATDSNGSVIGLGNPLTAAVVAPVFSGTLPSGNYPIVITWYDTYGHQTLPSPAVNVQLTSTGSLVISPPVAGAPAQAIGMDVYISGGLGFAYQGQTVTPTASFTQSAPLAAGAAPPILNSTVCQAVANDAAWPIAGYMVALIDASGNAVPGFPKQVQFIGPGSGYNLANGIPLWNGSVTYPAPILTVPYNHNTQGISGALNMTAYNVVNVGALGVGTLLPAWGVDVEGSGAAAAMNANQGYLVNGGAGTAGQALCSDGTYYDQPCTFMQPSNFFYQTVAANGTPQPQEPELNFIGGRWILSTTPSISTNVAFPATTGNEADIVTAAGPGTTGQCAVWLSTGGIGSSGFACPTAGFTNGNVGTNYWVKDPTGHIHEWGVITGSGSVSTGTTVSFPLTFPGSCTITPTVSGITIFGHGIGFPSVESGTLTSSGFTVEVGASSPIDGLDWQADGC